MKFALQMLLDFFIFKATKLAYRTGKLNPRKATQKGITSSSLSTECTQETGFLSLREFKESASQSLF